MLAVLLACLQTPSFTTLGDPSGYEEVAFRDGDAELGFAVGTVRGKTRNAFVYDDYGGLVLMNMDPFPSSTAEAVTTNGIIAGEVSHHPEHISPVVYLTLPYAGGYTIPLGAKGGGSLIFSEDEEWLAVSKAGEGDIAIGAWLAADPLSQFYSVYFYPPFPGAVSAFEMDHFVGGIYNPTLEVGGTMVTAEGGYRRPFLYDYATTKGWHFDHPLPWALRNVERVAWVQDTYEVWNTWNDKIHISYIHSTHSMGMEPLMVFGSTRVEAASGNGLVLYGDILVGSTEIPVLWVWRPHLGRYLPQSMYGLMDARGIRPPLEILTVDMVNTRGTRVYGACRDPASGRHHPYRLDWGWL